jgi:type I restriction enzyme S subunit
MSEQAKKLVPKLRFPEFQDAGDWEENKLENVCTKISQGGTPDTANQEYWNGDIEWLTPAEMGKLETRFITTTNRKISKSGLKNCSSELLPINSVILSTRAPIGHLLINKSKMAINQGCKGLVTLPSTDHNFLYYLLASNKSKLADLGAGNTFKELSGSALKNFKIQIPKKPEQQKIADCLSSIDELITAQTQKNAALKDHKKGLMQQLFPADGETVPKLRFPEFQDAGEWQEKTIGQVARYENGKAHEQDISEFGQYIVVNSKFISTDSEVKKYTNQGNCLAKKDDILMVLSDVPNGRAIAKCFIVDVDNKYTVNQRICKLTPTKVLSKILFYLINRSPYFLDFDDGVKQTNLKNDDVLNCPILLPENPLEQQKIADFLSYIDELITAQTQQLETYKAHKKGLIQQLFPVADEVVV